MVAGTWAVVEMLGHRQLVGQLSEVTVAGAAMLRVDVPSEPPGVVYVAPSSLYAITPTTEDVARARYARPPELSVTADHDYDDDWEDD